LVFVEEFSEVASANSRKTICYGESGLGRGDVLLFFTDGLFEALNEADVAFGEARLAAAVAKRRDRPVQRLLDEVVTEVERFTGSRKFDDNVCVLAMELA
jgi:phosphoserine phosphatase RsbU/P